MRRRRALGAFGLAITSGIAGCVGGSDPDPTADDSDSPSDADRDDADEDSSNDRPEAVNEYDYDTLTVRNVDVPLVPMDDAIEWYEADEGVVFADARDEMAFTQGRIAGAMLSPAPDGQREDDPLEDLPTDATIVTYCTCPHHLATLRGASLIKDGYSHTYALDEGFVAWVEAEHPVAQGETSAELSTYVIEGQTDAAYAGQYVWARHEPSGQREAVPIGAGGEFRLELHFYQIDRTSPIQLETPDATMTRPLAQLLDTTVAL